MLIKSKKKRCRQEILASFLNKKEAKMKRLMFDDNLKNINEVKNADIIFFSVSKRELLNKDYTRIENNIKILNEAGKLQRLESMSKMFGINVNIYFIF